MSKSKPVCPGMWVEDPQVTLSRNLRKLTKKWTKCTGKSIHTFCNMSGVAQSTFRNMRNGDSWPAPESLRRVASTLGVPIEVLLRR